MFASLFNWRSLLALLGIAIISGTIFYSQYLGSKIAKDEKQKVMQWVEASKAVVQNPGMDFSLPNMIRNEQTDIPIIETNERDSIVNFINIDSASVAHDPKFLSKKLKEFSKSNDPLLIILSQDPFIANKYYYGNTKLLNEVKYYPLIQLLIVIVFLVLILTLINIRNKSTQNQVWAGMAKETAHQLGTPLSSLQAWLEMLKEDNSSENIVKEMEKDVSRLKLVSDRFSKIGSTPKLESSNVIYQVQAMVEYMKKRAPGRVDFSVQTHDRDVLNAMISPPLFDWVIENLLKNALDAMEGKGKISADIQDHVDEIVVDISDTGKGISSANLAKIFKPGFTTKKRGWGLGLSLAKRIIDQYHQGELFVKNSEIGKGTTFRIVLKKEIKPER
ncbi:sensor histidine kinase [Pinibacter aurantiacus]|uniref:histidine kinase n=1 Tax=Pinibacter aurantiacus TaxID=2851599 RepID=A0A9E2W7J7_9BACT|nr:HAMP domain-containing sensor histidine kinase [Pinibacter aurantiacus]MBV4356806.1 HAMP domain-containing histidine kinase [Pinibacter aurantiacus]